MSKFPIKKIAICGTMRSGKDTVGSYLVNKYGFERFAFADEMKRVLHDLFPHIPRHPKPRKALQTFGEGLRSLDLPGAETVWIDACLRSLNTYIWWHAEVDSRGANVVVTDLRTPLEYERLKAEGFIVIRVTAPDELRVQRATEAGDVFSADDMAHDTEQYVNRYAVDFEIINDGSLADLWAKIDTIVED